MEIKLASSGLGFILDPKNGSWELVWLASPSSRVTGARMGAYWRRGKSTGKWTGPLDEQRVLGAVPLDTANGPAEHVRLEGAVPGEGVDVGLDFAALQGLPLLQWRVEIMNRTAEAIHLDRVDLVARGERSLISLGERGGEHAFFSNGWQSWSYSGTLGGQDFFPRTRLGPLTRPVRINAGTPHPRRRGHFSADMFGVLGNRRSRKGLVAGFLSQRQTFGTLEVRLERGAPWLRMWANCDGVQIDPGESFVTDWACAQFVDLDAEDPLSPYLEAVARENGARRDGLVPVGWCSWYYFESRVTEQHVLENLAWVEEHRHEAPLQLIQLDDGFEALPGDWDRLRDTFPSGMKEISDSIRRAGLQPGVWLAPFLADSASDVVREHPEWVLRSRSGRPANAGYVLNTFTPALDVTHPEVLEHIRRLIRTACVDWGFDYLKLDFLYAGAIQGKRFDPRLTRAQGLYQALRQIREAAGENVTLLGCGCPLGSGIGVFDAMRIGPDVASRWLPAYRGIELYFKAEPDYPATRNALRNVITRAPMHGRWWINDPDCAMFRASDTLLTPSEVQTLATVVALSAGSMVVSDNLPSLEKDRVDWLARLLPPLPRPARAVDWFDASYPSLLVLPLSGVVGEWHLAAVINWADRKARMKVDLRRLGIMKPDTHHVVDFWRNSYCRIDGRVPLVLEVPPHGVRLLGIRSATEGPAWLGDTVHVSQGLAVREWEVMPDSVSALLNLGRRASGRAWLSLPVAPRSVWLNRSTCPWETTAEGVYSVDLAFEGAAKLVIKY